MCLGNVPPGTPQACQGWERRSDEGIDQQFWVPKRWNTNGSYHLKSLRGPVYLDLEAGFVINEVGGRI